MAVIGSAGFLGGALTRALERVGSETSGFTRSRPFADAAGSPAADLVNSEAIVYFATSVTPATAEQDPSAVEEDLAVFERFLTCVRGLERRALVVLPSSGGTLYDPDTTPPYAETDPVRPVAAYGRSRLELENRLLGIPADVVEAAVLRISNVYGPGQRLDRGQGVIGHWMAAAAAGEPLRQFGDPSSTRDYVFVDDVVRAIVSVLQAPRDDRPTVLNIGSGVPTSLAELAGTISDIVGGATVLHEPARGFDRRDTWLDVRLAERSIGWVPEIGLAEGLRRTWEHVRRHGP